ncbi:MAG TPA: choice-of-anchor D domain-containing protein [Pirellulales bacterium]|nr:choice-of-anchor D domain-containing protein [Pirellulales bacterium]
MSLESLETRAMLTTPGTWTLVTGSNPTAAPTGTQAVALLSNGSVLVQQGSDAATNTWFELTPDATGSYVNGTWSTVSSSNVARLFFPSALLQNGNLFVVGGEYSDPNSDNNDTNTAEIFNPYVGTGGTWTNIPSDPTPDSSLGDDPIEVLPDGNVLTGWLNGPQTYIYNPTTNTWSSGGTKLYDDPSAEETWVKLPDGSILSYDITSTINGGVFQAQRYIPATNTWVDASSMNPADPATILSSTNVGYELGPGFLMTNGNVILFGATGTTDIYDPTTNQWSAGPNEPTVSINGQQTQLVATDDPGAEMVNGDILISLSPLGNSTGGEYSFPNGTYIFEFNPTTNTYTDVTPASVAFANLFGNPPGENAYQLNMLDLPNGQVLLANELGPMEVYTPVGSPQTSWQPVITGIGFNGGNTYTLTGTQLNGLDEGAVYGDDNAMDTNYPIVQLTSPTGTIIYAETYDWSSTGVATGGLEESVKFTVPTTLTAGIYTVTESANGISSTNTVDLPPGMEVFGNGHSIPYNETTTSTTNDTNFGSIYASGGTAFETYTITNYSTIATLDISSISVVPVGTLTGFSVSTPPASDTLAPGQSTTFTVEFAPTLAGAVTGKVEIFSNDGADPEPFVFNVSGTALAPFAAMAVEGDGQTISYNESSPSTTNATSFGSALDNGGTVIETYTILSNGGALPLTIAGVTIVPVSGSGGFTVSAQPASLDVPTGQSTTFTVQFAPIGPGPVVADVEIASDDSSHPDPFVFEVSGTGVNPPPAIVASIDNSNPTGFSTTGSWSTYSAGVNGSELYALPGNGSSQADYTFTGLAPGQYEILGTWAPLQNAASNTSFTFYDSGKPVGATIANQSVAPNGASVAGWQILGIVDITSSTLRVAITNNAGGDVIADSIEIGPLPGVVVKYPELGVSDNLTGVATNATPETANGTDFGSTPVGFGDVVHTFTLTNYGLATLTFGSTPVRAVGSSFTIVSQPAVTSLAPGASTTFQVAFSPTATGLQTGSVAIVTNDPDYPSAFELFLQGTGTTPTAVQDTAAALVGTWTQNSTGFGGTDHAAPAGTGTSTATFSFSGLTAGSYLVYTTWPASSSLASNAPFTLYNGSTAVGTIAVNEKVAPNGPTYSGTTFQLLGTVNVTGTSLKVVLSNKANGTVAADAVVIVPIVATSTQSIALTGDGVAIANNNGAESASNGTNFGETIAPGGSITETYTISNSGGQTLTLTGAAPVTVSGTGFSLVSQPAVDSLAPGASVTFQVKFAPTTPGVVNGAITIASNDPVAPSFKINITGDGITAGEIGVSGNSVAIAPGGTPQIANGTNFGSVTENTPAAAVTETYTITNNGQSTLTLTGVTPVSITGAGFSVVSQPASDSLAPGASTTFQIKFAPTSVGLQTGTVTILSSDPQLGTFTFNIQGTGLTSTTATPTIIDDSGSGFSLAGTWSTTKFGFDSGEHYAKAAPGVGGSQATWSFAGLTTGVYMIYATWSTVNAPATIATNSPFTLYNGNTSVGTVSVDQQLLPSGSSFSNTAFQYLGTVTVTGTLLRVTLNNNANGIVLADAIAIVKAPSGDLSITKTDNDGGSSITAAVGSAIPGDTITYTIKVANSGPSAANGATVADTFPAGILSDTYTVATTGGAVDLTHAASGSGNIADTVDLPSGATITYTVTATVNPSATGSLANTATVTDPAGFVDANPANNTATDTDTLTPNVDLTIAKTDNDGGSSVTPTTGTAAPGAAITYTITVTNTGPSNAVGATVADAILTNPDFASDTFTAVGTTGASGFTASGSGNIDDTASLAAGSSITYTVVADISSSATGTLSNMATVAAGSGETAVPASVLSATDTDNLVPTVVLTITKTDNDGGSSVTDAIGNASAGGTITYTITVTNSGPSNAVGMIVADPLTTNADFTSVSYTAVGTAGAAGFTASGSGNIDDTVNLAAGSSITYTVMADISATATGTISNFATIAAGAGETLGAGSITTATDNDVIPTTVTLTITKTDDDGGSSVTPATGAAAPGSVITYTITVSNTGASNAVGAVVADTLTTNTDLTSDTFTAVGTAGATGFTASSSGDIDDTVNLAAGSTITYTVVADISSSASGTLSNTATVAAGTGDVLSNTSVPSAIDTDTLSPTVDLVITKTDSDGGSSVTNATGSASPGTVITYTITVTNTGTTAVTGATVADLLATNTDISTDTYTAVGTTGATGFTASGTGSINDTVALAAGSTITYTVAADIAASATGTLTNSATVAPPAGESLGAGSVGTAAVNDTLTPTVILTIAKSDNDGGSSTTNTTGAATPGTQITYTVTVTNFGPSNAVGALISDPLTSNLDFTAETYAAVGTAGATGFTASGTGNISDTVDLAAGSSITYTVTATISDTATGTLSNTTTVAAGSGETLGSGSLVSATDSDTL